LENPGFKAPYLRTHADGKFNDNLLAQDECGSACKLVARPPALPPRIIQQVAAAFGNRGRFLPKPLDMVLKWAYSANGWKIWASKCQCCLGC
jgi:hypothetical protein